MPRPQKQLNHPRYKYTIDEVVSALRASGGNIRKAAKSLGAPRGTIAARVSRDPTLQALVKDCREGNIEECLDLLMRVVRGEEVNGQPVRPSESISAAKYYVSVMGRGSRLLSPPSVEELEERAGAGHPQDAQIARDLEDRTERLEQLQAQLDALE